MTQPTPTSTPPPGEPAPAPTNPPTPAPTPAPPGEPADVPLGPAGERALAAEREARKALERQVAEFAPLKQLAASLAGGQSPAGGKSEVEVLREQFETHQQQLAEERALRWRAEVAQAKGLTAEQAAWLAGATREDFEAAADRLLAAFPAAPAGLRTPVPDPSQGVRGLPGGAGDLEVQIVEAQKAGDWRRVAALQKSKLANVKR